MMILKALWNAGETIEIKDLGQGEFFCLWYKSNGKYTNATEGTAIEAVEDARCKSTSTTNMHMLFAEVAAKAFESSEVERKYRELEKRNFRVGTITQIENALENLLVDD